MSCPVAVIFNRLGPYHCARLRAAAGHGELAGVEVVRKDTVYEWDLVQDDASFHRKTLFPECNGRKPAPGEIQGRLWDWLDGEQPSAVALPGWSCVESLAALAWCVRRGVPTVMMSESQTVDRPRDARAEWVKKRVVKLTGAALAGGRSNAEYLRMLGFPGERIFTGYDVVDNEHFAQGVEKVRRDGDCRSRLHLPGHFFLTCCRFVPEKNLLRLLDAYARYRKRAAEAWSLVLVGDGPLRGEIQTAINRLELEDWVLAPGFMQYETLPAYYGLADAFLLPSVVEPWGLVVNEAMAAGLPVLVSQRCGCAPDLVEEGTNGWTFDPLDVDGLAELMVRVSELPVEQRRAMGHASREIIARWTPETFAEGLWRAVEAAQSAPLLKPSVVERSLLWLLMRR